MLKSSKRDKHDVSLMAVFMKTYLRCVLLVGSTSLDQMRVFTGQMQKLTPISEIRTAARVGSRVMECTPYRIVHSRRRAGDQASANVSQEEESLV